MIRSAITICLVPEACQGPFVFHDGLRAGCERAAAHGFAAVEVFPRHAGELDAREMRHLLRDHGLQLAAMGTGAGWLVDRLTLTHPDAAVRRRAADFVKGIIDFAAAFGAPAILGSMQGRVEPGAERAQALGWLAEHLEQLGPRAHAAGVPLLVEPLNRYETNLLNTIPDTLDLINSLRTQNVKVLADLFHMNIEESSIEGAIRAAGARLGHVHFADSNRRAIGLGHTPIEPVASALREIDYAGLVSAEIFPLPDAETAARQTIHSFRQYFTTP